MATAGTLLSDLDGKAPVFSNKDDDLVNKILADMNIPSSANPVMQSQQAMHAPPPPSGHGNRMIQAPNPNTTYPMSSDPATATAHMIGKEYPSPADFANLMHSPQYGHGGSAYTPLGQPAAPVLIQPTKGNVYSDIMSQMKQPLLVAIIIFIVSLPIINVLIGHYLPSLLRLSGELTTVGLGVKSLVGGFLFWFIQKILVPLMVV
jgi:hypothetical protein